MAGAVAVIGVSRFALRGGQAWAWWFLFFCFVWVGLHDAWFCDKVLSAYRPTTRSDALHVLHFDGDWTFQVSAGRFPVTRARGLDVLLALSRHCDNPLTRQEFLSMAV